MEQLDKLIEKKIADAEVVVAYINQNKEAIKTARENKELTLDAYRVNIASMLLNCYKHQLGTLLSLKKGLGEEIDEKYKDLLTIETVYANIVDGKIEFKGEDVVKDLIENTINKKDNETN